MRRSQPLRRRHPTKRTPKFVPPSPLTFIGRRNQGSRDGVQNHAFAYVRWFAVGVASETSGALFSVLGDGELAPGRCLMAWKGEVSPRLPLA